MKDIRRFVSINRRFVIMGAILIAVWVLIWSIGVIWQNTASALEMQRIRSIPLEERLQPPFDLVERPVPVAGEEVLTFPQDVGTFAQITVKGQPEHVMSRCRLGELSLAQDMMCGAHVLDDATYLSWTRYQYRADIPVTLVVAYFGEMPLDPELEPEVESTEVASAADAFEMSTETDDATDTLPWLSSDATRAMRALLDYSRANGRTGNFVLVDGVAVQHYFSRNDDQVAFTWQHGDWIYITSSNNLAVLEHFINQYPY